MVQPAEGKVFDPASLDVAAIGALESVAVVSFVLEESAMLEYRGRQTTVTLRGIDSLFSQVVPIDRMMFSGTYGGGGAGVGQGIAYEMGIRPGMAEQMRFYVPSRRAWSALLPMTGVSSVDVPVEGIFVLDADTDGEYVLAPIERVRRLFDYEGMASGLAIRLAEGASERKTKELVSQIAGGDFRTLTRYEQKESMYRIMKLEKWGIFTIGLAVLVIASFSIVGSLIMLIIDKKGGIRTLAAMGANTGFVRGIFIRQGMMIGAIGAVAGLVLGLAVCAVQTCRCPGRRSSSTAIPYSCGESISPWYARHF